MKIKSNVNTRIKTKFGKVVRNPDFVPGARYPLPEFLRDKDEFKIIAPGEHTYNFDYRDPLVNMQLKALVESGLIETEVPLPELGEVVFEPDEKSGMAIKAVVKKKEKKDVKKSAEKSGGTARKKDTNIRKGGVSNDVAVEKKSVSAKGSEVAE